MAGIIVGSASVTIVPDAGAFPNQLRQQVMPEAQRVGAELGQSMGRELANAIAQGMQDGLRNAPTGESRRAGEATGRSFGETFKAQVDQALRSLPDAELHADSSQVDRKIAEIRARLQELSDARVGVDIDAAAATAELDRLRIELQSLSRDSADVDVRVDTARAEAALRVIRDEVDRLDGDDATVDVNVDDHGSAAEAERGIGGLRAALISLAPAAIPVGAALVGGLAGVVTVAGAAAGGLGVLALGVSGVSDAVKLLGQEQAAATADAAKASGAAAAQAAAESAAAQQITSARQSLADARRSAAQAEVDSAEKVRNAEQSLADARRQAAQDRIAADRQVESAEDSYAQSVQRVQDAEQSLADARRQAQRDLLNYADAQTDADLAHRQSVLDLETAQANYDKVMASSTSTDQQKAQAQLDLDRAQQDVVESNQRLQQSTEDNTAAQQAGVDGAPAVVSATRQVADAKDAQRNASQALADAERASAEQQRKSAETIAKAEQGVRDAVRDQSRQQQASAEQIQKAQQQVTQAMQQARTASQGAGAAGVTALAGIHAQLDKVNPATLTFARFVQGTLAPAFDKLKATAAGGILPGLESGLRSMMPLFPMLNRFVGIVAGTMGNLFAQAGKALNSPFWRQFFEYMGRSAGPILQTLGRIIGNFAKGFAGLIEAFAPVTRMIGGGLLSLSRMFANFGASAGRNAGFQAFIGYIRQSMPVVVDLLRNLGGVFGHLLTALAPLGLVLLKVIDALVGFLAKLSPNQLLAVIGVIAGAIVGLGLAFDAIPMLISAVVIALTAAAALIVNNWDKIEPAIRPVLNVFAEIYSFVVDKIVPALQQSFHQALDGLRSALHTVGQALEGHRAQLEQVLHVVEQVALFIAKSLGPIMKFTFEAIGQYIRVTIDILAGFVEAIDWMITAGKKVADWFAGPFVHFFTGAWDAVTGAFHDALSWVTTTWSAGWAGAKSLITTPIHDAKVYLDNVWANTKAAFTEVKDWVITRWSFAWAVAKDKITEPVHAAKLFLDNTWSNVRDAFTAVKDWVTSRWSAAWSAVKDVLTTPIHNGKVAIDTIWSNVRDAFSSVADWAGDKFRDAWSVVRTVLTHPIQSAMDTFRSVFGKGGTLRSLFSDAVGAVKGIWDDLRGIFAAPIAFLIDTVLNKGLIWAWNKIDAIIPGDQHIDDIKLPKVFRAAGGAVFGEGTATSDSIHAMLSNNEHVWSAAEVAGAGGHAEVAKMRAAARGDDVPRYAKGGAVTADKIKQFLWSTNPLPYVFGASGPNSYDCSGLVSTVYNIIEGMSPYQRRFSTSNEAGYFRDGRGVFTIGVSNNSREAHTAGRFAGLGFEARDTAEGIIIGKNARSPETFDRTMYLPAAEILGAPGGAISGQLNGGGTGILGNVAGSVSSALNPAHLISLFKGYIEKPLAAIQKFAGTPVGNMIVGMPKAIAGQMIGGIGDLAQSVVGLGGPTISGHGSVGGQNGYAQIVINTAKAMGLGRKGAEIGLETALAESNLRNYANSNIPASLKIPHDAVGSDHYSAGIFQQQTGPFGDYWGTVAQVMNPAYASQRFYQELLRKVPNFRSIASGVAAQTVQVSEYPDAYAARQGEADAYLAKYYDQGGWLEPGPTMTYNGTGRPEAVLTAPQWDTMAAAASGGGIGDITVHVAIGDEAIDPRMVRITNVTIDKRVDGAKHAAASGHPGGPLGAMGSPHARATSR